MPGSATAPAGRTSVAGPLRPAPLDQTDLLQQPQVMSQQIGRQPQQMAQLARRLVADHQRVDHRQPRRITKRRMHPGPLHQRLSLSVH